MPESLLKKKTEMKSEMKHKHTSDMTIISTSAQAAAMFRAAMAKEQREERFYDLSHAV